MTIGVQFKEYRENGKIYLLITDTEKGKAKSGITLIVRPSLLRPHSKLESDIGPSLFRREMSTTVESSARNGSTAHLLQSDYHDNSASITRFPLLGRKIISGATKWSSHNLKIPGDFSYVPKYWEWTEDILSRFGDTLTECSIHGAVYASLYSYDRDPNVMRAFFESWCPTTNTLHTMAGEVSMSLWDVHKICGLPISGLLYDEVVPNCELLQGVNKEGDRLVPRACENLFAAYYRLKKGSEVGVSAEQWVKFWCKRKLVHAAPPKRRRYTETAPTKTHNPDGTFKPAQRGWSVDEMKVFNDLGITKEGHRERTYLAAFLSCWLCVFVLPDSEERFIRPGTFEIASHMAMGSKFSLAIPVLASIYRGLNTLVNSSKPSFSGCYFPAHYIYSWLAFYFGTHHVVDPCPPGPAMVTYSGAQSSKWMKDDKARELIHEGKTIKWGCNMLSKNRREVLTDDGSLSSLQHDYLVSLRSGYLPVRHDDRFHIEPYSPRRFSRQFGFCQGIPGQFLGTNTSRDVSYRQALRYWNILLYVGSQSSVFLPCYSLRLEHFVTEHFHDWWSEVNVRDLRDKVDTLQKCVESDSLKSRKDKKSWQDDKHVELDNPDDEVSDETPNVAKTVPPVKNSTGSHGKGIESDGSDKESDTNFKHRRGKKKTSTTTSRYDADFFGDVPECSNMTSGLPMDGDFDLSQEIQNLANGPLLNDLNQGTNIHRLEPRSGKHYDIVKQLAPKTFVENEEDGCTSPAHSQRSVGGPHSLETAAKKTIGALQIAGDVVASPVKKSLAPTLSVTSFRPGPLSKNIFAEAILVIGAQYLASLKDAPFADVDSRYQEASTVYKGIEQLKGNSAPLKRKVDSYVSSVKSYLVLEHVAAKRKRPDELEREIAVYTEKITQAESKLNTARADHDTLERKRSAVELRIAGLELELRNAREEEHRLKSELESKGTLITEVETQVAAAKQALEEVEASQALTHEEVAELEEHRKSLIEHQSSINPAEWMDLE